MKWTGRIWNISSSENKTGNSLYEEDIINKKKKIEEVRNDEDIKKIFDMFPGSTIHSIEEINDNDFENIDQRGRSREAIKETEAAISRVVSGEQRVELMAQPPYVRRLQHGLAARNNLGSASTGREPSRRVVIRRRRR